MTGRSTLRQFVVVFTGTVVALMVVVKTNLFEHISYSVEKGRLKALSEVVPDEDAVNRLNEPNRIVADLVRPAVVHVNSFRSVAVDADGMLAGIEAFLGGEDDADSDEDEKPETSTDPRTFSHENIQVGLGSGFVFDADNGLILTNYHVIADADRIEVRLSDGRHRNATLVSSDEETDLAVLRVDADRLHEIRIADSKGVHVGDEVFALGNPFGLDGTFSRGIVSGLGRRTNVMGGQYQGFIQTDAVINPGNSGGPLVNVRGEVIGVNTAIATESGTFSGVGFAIPSGHVLDLLPFLANGESVVRSFLGVVAADVHQERALADELSWDRDDGVVVMRVSEGTPADAIGLQRHDILVKIDGRSMTGIEEFRHKIAVVGIDREVPLLIFRDGEFIELQVRLIRRPDDL